MLSKVKINGVVSMCNQQEMDKNLSRENVSGWPKMKRQHSPSCETRHIKKRNVTEHVPVDVINDKENVRKVQNSEQNGKKSYSLSNKRLIKEKVGKEVVTEHQQRERHSVYFTGQDIENDFDMDDIFQINLNLDKVPLKYCDDRMFVNLVTKNDMRSQDSIVEHKFRQTDDNFKQKVKKPLDELLDLFNIRCNEEGLQYLLVGMKLQLMGMEIAKLAFINVKITEPLIGLTLIKNDRIYRNFRRNYYMCVSKLYGTYMEQMSTGEA